jgi:NADH-quinone oxidoreductase subunit A
MSKNSSDLWTIDPDNSDPQKMRKLMEYSTQTGNPAANKQALIQRRDQEIAANRSKATDMSRLAFLDIIFFFGVLLVGFAYLWVRGDLDWVRSIAAQKQAEAQAEEAEREEQQMAAS